MTTVSTRIGAGVGLGAGIVSAATGLTSAGFTAATGLTAAAIFGFAFAAFVVFIFAAALVAALRTGFFADLAAVIFFAVGFFAAVFFAADFFATVFLTTAFFAAAFFPAGFFAAALATGRFTFAASAAIVLLLFALLLLALAAFVPFAFFDFFSLFAFLAFFFAAAMDGVSFFGPPRAMPLSARKVLRRHDEDEPSRGFRQRPFRHRMLLKSIFLRQNGLIPDYPDAIASVRRQSNDA